MIAPKMSSDHTSNENDYHFFVAVPLAGLEAISDALVERISWTSPLLESERRIVPGPVKEFRQWLKGWQEALFREERRQQSAAVPLKKICLSSTPSLFSRLEGIHLVLQKENDSTISIR